MTMKTLVAVAALVATIASPAFAQTSRQPNGTSVYSGDQYLGADPDANIRSELLREQNWRNGGY
jgi:hypothetical protein